MIKRVAMVVALVAMTGLLVFGGVHRTQSVLAGEGGKGSESVRTLEGSTGATVGGRGEGAGTGQGKGRGLGNGAGRGLHGAGAGQEGATPDGTSGE